MNYILDGSALVAYLRDEAGAEIVERLLLDTRNPCFAHAINLCEVFYDFHRANGEADAQSAVGRLLAARVLPRDDMDPALWQQAGRHKAAYRRISIADCFCIALAQKLNGEVVTCDHHEFDTIVPFNLCPIQFIR
jgi:PIN domain nuclease of toxin-antitoxin system